MDINTLPDPGEYINASSSGLAVRFHLLPVKDEEQSKAQGRPIFKETEFIEIKVPGDRTMASDEIVTDEHRHRFAQQYARFKATGESSAVGTPLENWAAVTRADVEEMRYFNVRTVEQLAGLSDANARNVGAVLSLRKKAQDWLAAAEKGAPVAALRSEIERRDAEIDTLKGMVKEMGEQIARLSKAPAAVPVSPTQPTADEKHHAALTMGQDPAKVEVSVAPKRRGRPPKVKV